MYVATDTDDLDRLVRGQQSSLTLVVDADNTLVPQGVGAAEFQSTLSSAVTHLSSLPEIARVVVASNGPNRGLPSVVIHRANKPWTTRARLGLKGREEDVWVVGDQVLTDGILAWRLRATFVHLVLDAITEDRRQSILRRLGGFLTSALFVRPTE